MSLTQAMYAASAGAFKNQQKLDVLANNLANINTPGFKQDKLVFRVPVEAERGGDSHVDYLQGPSAAMARGAWTDFSQGILKHTGNPLDLGLDVRGSSVFRQRGGRVTPGMEVLQSMGMVFWPPRTDTRFWVQGAK